MEDSTRARSAARRPRRGLTIAIALGVGFVLFVGAALGTPGVGILIPPPAFHARGTTDGKLNVSSDAGIKLKTKSAVDVVTQQILIAGGGHTGWHSHPGPVLVTVKSGALRLIYANDCTGQGSVYEAGDTFVDRGDEVVHIARNESLTNNVEFWATYFVPGAPGTPFRIDELDPGPPPTCDEDDDDEDDDDD